MKKKHRTRARKRKELIQEILEARKGPRQINKHRNKQMIMVKRKESGEIASDREEILKNMCRFYKALYPNSSHTRKYNEIKSRHSRNTRVYEEEVERAIKRMKRQSPRNGWN